MLTCVCRPVSGNLPKMPPSMLPMPKVTPATAAATSFASASFASAAAATTASSLTASASTVGRQATIVVTAEPKLNVPGRLTSAELRAMALRQQQQIDSQHQLLATKEQRLRFLKTQEVRNAVANAEGERLRRLRERVEAQESKLRRLRALRGQVDLQKTYNVTLSNDLDSIRALFSEKEKELSLAVAKVEALTRQLEDLRRDRRCPINLLAGGGGSGGGGVTAAGASAAGQTLPPQASRELEKLRRELMYRNQLSLQQDARLHLQREALQQRQAELRSVDQRIYELQTRLQRKKAANVQVVQQQQQQPPHHPLHGPTATTTTGSHLMAHHQQQQQHHHQQQQQQHQMQSLHEAHAQQQHHQQQHQQHQQHQQQQQQQHQQKLQHLQQQQQHQQQQQVSNNPDFQTNLAKQGVAALKQQLLQKHATATSAAAAAAATNNNNTTSQPPLPHHNNQPQQQGQSHIGKFSNHIGNREPNRHMQRGNVAAVEPYIHTPQKSSITPPSSALYLGGGGGPGNHQLKHAAATANTNQQNQLIQDMTHVKLQLTNAHPPTSAATATASTAASAPAQSHNAAPFFSGESDESKLAKKLLSASLAAKNAAAELHKPKASPEIDSSHHIYAEVGPKKRDLVKEAPASAHESATNGSGAPVASTAAATPSASKIPKSIVTSISASAVISKLNSNNNASSPSTTTTTTSVSAPRDHGEKKSELSVASETLSEKNTHQLTVHSMPLGAANKSVATAIAAAESQSAATNLTKPPPHKLQHPSGHSSAANANLAVPPRKPISSVAPTSVSSSSSIPKMITYSPKVNRVAPNVVSTSSSTSTANTTSNSQASNNNSQAANVTSANDVRPALPPKPNKMLTPPEATADSTNNNSSNNKKATESSSSLATLNINDNLPIKAKPLTIRKQPMSEQPRLKSSTSLAIKPLASQGTRQGRDMPSATSLLFPDSTRQAKETDSERRSPPEQQQQHSPNNNNNNNMQNSMDELDKIEAGGSHADLEVSPDSLKKRQRASSAMQNGNMGGGGPVTSGPATGSTATTTSSTTTKSSNGKPKLARRVSFDPLALLLDASLEGELELVKKTAMQVANPSAANDEGITALHNAICAGHFDIVKFLVEFGCDVNAQDSDGWTPLHCAASCNNLSMVKFLVENGACLFAATLSDHETPAEKCEEDEEGFDGCSEYLYSIQEKLGILHNGEVYAVFSYEAQNSDELTFNVNDRLMILRKGDDSENEWWWAKNSSDEEGYVPRNLLGLYPRVPPQSSNFND